MRPTTAIAITTGSGATSITANGANDTLTINAAALGSNNNDNNNNYYNNNIRR